MTSAESTLSIIPARSRRQAMDWSLVLISQGIEAVIQESDGRWMLLVDPQTRSRALSTLRQYQIENRGWRWRQSMPWPEITFHWGALAWCFALAAFHWLNAASGARLESAGSMDSVAVANGSWWRLFTATMLHFDLTHLMANLTIGLPVIGLAMGRYGPACALLAACAAGTFGNIASFLVHTGPYRGLGASGVVMGGLGLLAIQSLSLRFKNRTSSNYIFVGVISGVMLFTLLGLSPSSDITAHLGGFIGGLTLGAAMALVPQKRLLATATNIICGGALAGLVALTWTLALRHAAPVP